jgi:hypothetical protein
LKFPREQEISLPEITPMRVSSSGDDPQNLLELKQNNPATS